MTVQFDRIRDCLRDFEFQRLFVEELGWSRPTEKRPVVFAVKGASFERCEIAQLAAVAVFEITSEGGRIPDYKTRIAVHKEIARHFHENLIIFLDRERTQSLWVWGKRQNGKVLPREHLYAKGQPGDLFISKVGQIVFDMGDFDEQGKVPLVEVVYRLRRALDVERVTKRFYGEFRDQHVAFLELIRGVSDDRQRRWYASVLLNRLMFIYFLQRKGFIDSGDLNYLQNKLADSQRSGRDRFFRGFLKLLFFEGFAKPEEKRSREVRQVLGSIRYLNGGLFLPHTVEQHNPELDVPDKAFENLLALFSRYSWNLNDTPGGMDNEINPDVLGYIFEKYINQKSFGAYYTRPEITEYLCERTIHRLILDAVNTPQEARSYPIRGLKPRDYPGIAELLLDLDARLCKQLLSHVLPNLSLLDPACGSGAFLVAAMKTLVNIYAAIIGKIKFLQVPELSRWLTEVEREHISLSYYIKKRIITDNLFGVDIMEEATEIARLRLFLALVASAESADQLEPLPNIDFNILSGNSLMGLMRVRDEDFNRRQKQGELAELSRKSYREILEEKNRLLESYRHAATYAEDLTSLRDNIQEKKEESLATLDDILLDEFRDPGIKFEEATWDASKNKPGKTRKRPLNIDDVRRLQPFHWGYEFDQILNQRGGFDAIITNPPWEIFKPNAKEFFEEFSEVVTKNKMMIHEFEREQAKLLRNPEVRGAWLCYLSSYPHVSAFYRSAPQYENQISIVNGKKAGSDINLYKLFTEQCFNLLRPGGQCGIVIPSGIYTDLGAKQLREMLLSKARITGLFGFENRKQIFENVDSRYKFVVLTFEKGAQTERFPAAFMRLDVNELEHFPREGAIEVSVDLVRRLSPDSLSLMEFKNQMEVRFSETISRHPSLDADQSSYKHIRFCREIDPTAHRELFSTTKQKGLCPLLEGRNIHQFTHVFSNDVRFWIREQDGRRLVLGRTEDHGQHLDYQVFRLGFRKIARNTDERTMISTLVPPTFVSENLQTACVLDTDGKRLVTNGDMLLLTAIFNSFVFDAVVRLKVSANMNFFFVYSSQVPRKGTKYDNRVIMRAARLICTTPEYDDLAKEVGLKSHKHGATDPVERARLRAELDGLIAHNYGLTEEEFAHILTTFPLVPDSVKVATRNAYRDVERGLIQ